MSRYIAKRAKKTRVVRLMSGASADGQVTPALVMRSRGVDLDRALEILKAHHQLLRSAIAEALE